MKEEALKLADYIDNHAFGYETATKCQIMIRKQAKYIEELEQVNKALVDSRDRWKTAFKELGDLINAEVKS